MANWKLAPSLCALRAECNDIASDRSTASDGTIGDQSHSRRASDHNPGSRNFVHALDLTQDREAGMDIHALAEELRCRKDPRLKYIISHGRIASAPDFEWRPYKGGNKHDLHVHFSIRSTVAAESDIRPWFPKEKASVPPIQIKQIPATPEEDPGMEPMDATVAPDGGVWVLTKDGGVRAYQRAPFHGSYPGLPESERQGTRTFVKIEWNERRGYDIFSDDGCRYSFPIVQPQNV